jgi:hypothetical protein
MVVNLLVGCGVLLSSIVAFGVAVADIAREGPRQDN